MMIGDCDLLTFRQGYYSLFVSILWKEPAGELLLSLSNGIGERIDAARNLHPSLGQGWEDLSCFFRDTPSTHLVEAVADEYTRLFLGPHGPVVNPYESFYLTGSLWDRPLANLRAFLKAIGIEKQEGYAEPEDFLAFELEVMRWLTGKQTTAGQPEEEKRWLRYQSEFLKEHLLVWAPTCAEEIERAQGAKFYRGVGKMLRGFLEMERDLFRDWGLDKVTSLAEARQRWGAIPAWKGPTFDFPGDVREPQSNEEAKEPLPKGKSGGQRGGK